MTDHIVKNISLSDFGRKELSVTETEMPRLMALPSEYGETKPLKGAPFVGSLYTTIQLGYAVGATHPLSIYQRTVAYGHFGRASDTDGGFNCKPTNLIQAVKVGI